MLILEILTYGMHVRIQVESYQVVQNCHYAKCGAEFLTSDPDKTHCKPQHRKYAWGFRSILKDSAVLSNS